MKYFIDTEFIEGFHKPLFGKRRHFIDLISIGIVAEDGREYYAIGNEFDLKTVWNKWEVAECCHVPEICMARVSGECRGYQKNYWLRDNVLKEIHAELCKKQSNYAKTYHYNLFEPFTFKSLKTLIAWHGLSNKRIAAEIMAFVNPCSGNNSLNYGTWNNHLNKFKVIAAENRPIEFYGYYADYDWVLFCSLFGRMIDLPKGFPMYCRDLKQMLDARVEENVMRVEDKYAGETRFETTLRIVKNHSQFPKQEDEHNALADAKWNYELYQFLQIGDILPPKQESQPAKNLQS